MVLITDSQCSCEVGRSLFFFPLPLPFPFLPWTCGLSSVLTEPPCTGLWLPVLKSDPNLCCEVFPPTKGGKEENNSCEWIGVSCDLYTCWQQIPRLVLATQVEQMEQIDKIVFTHAVLKKQLSCFLKLKVGVWYFSLVVEFLVIS